MDGHTRHLATEGLATDEKMTKVKKNEEQSDLSDSEVFDSESEGDSSIMELSETSEDEDFIPVSNLFYYYLENTE